MEKLLDSNVKDLITVYPAIAETLNALGIGCADCAVGTCRLRDIVEVHNLMQSAEQALFAAIARIVYPGKSVVLPTLSRAAASQGAAKKMSPPLRMLVDEHTVIKRVIAAIPKIMGALRKNATGDATAVLAAIEFIRNYADRFHHAKEEEILFRLFDPAPEIIVVMNREHDIGRGHVRGAAAALASENLEVVEKHLAAYAALLTEHIRKEDEILYPWIDRQLTDAQIGKLYAEFNEVAAKFGDEPERQAAFANSLY